MWTERGLYLADSFVTRTPVLSDPLTLLWSHCRAFAMSLVRTIGYLSRPFRVTPAYECCLRQFLFYGCVEEWPHNS